MNYFLRPCSHEWYLSLFEPGAGRITGEITPAYCVMSEGQISDMIKLLPDVKIIYQMREPVDRIWSLIKYHQKRKMGVKISLSVNELYEYSRQKNIVDQSNFEEILKRWRRHMKPDNFFVSFYDEISEHPDELQERLYGFLGLQHISEESSSRKNERINPSFNAEMPQPLAARLVRDYLPMIKRLSAQEGGYFTRWLEKYDSFV